MNNVKILDIKRSFIPVEPNAFPENYHVTQAEDKPEESAPVVPYIGHNFLPTAHGYKSFFGTNTAVDALALPGEAEMVFLYQTMAYRNILIALCNNGIWAKDATTPGAWTQLVALAVPAEGIYYEWFHTTISNRLYVYRGNGNNFYEIDTDIAQPLGIVVNVKTPTFITPNAQLGMFRLGMRIGFWDAENAIAYSSPDDVEDFKPDPITGANVTTFTSVVGKISAIRPHGRDAIIYASKSVTALQVSAGDTFLLKAIPLIQAGVAYQRQSVEAYPSTMHFCYASTGIYKIENGKADVIVPEVFDYFKPYSDQPVYLKLLQGRYLCFEVMNADALNGVPQFSKITYPPATITFPGSKSLDYHSTLDPADINWCQHLDAMNSGNINEIQAAANEQLPDKKEGTTATPIWTCYLSNNGLKDISNLTYDQTPCAVAAHDGTLWNLNPQIVGMGSYTTDSSNKNAVSGDDAWVDGKWTMERFLQTQTAIWNAEEKIVEAVISDILSKAYTKTTTTTEVPGCVVSNPAWTECEHGPYASAFSPHYFGYNACSFWLTRFVIETKTINAKSRTTTQCISDASTIIVVQPDHFELWDGGSQVSGTGNYASPGDAAAAYSVLAGTAYSVYTPGNGGSGGPSGTDSFRSNGALAVRQGSSGPVGPEIQAVYINPQPTSRSMIRGLKAGESWGAGTAVDGAGLPLIWAYYDGGYTTQIRTSNASNELKATNSGILGVETAYCEITGWSYTKNDGTQATAPANACLVTDSAYPGSPSGSTTRTVPVDISAQPGLLNPANGSICDLEFESPLIPAGVDWDDQTLELLPGGFFLFQDGSIAPRWPTMVGMFAYDLHLKKWGKHKGEYKQLLDYHPINSDSAIPVTGMNQGMLAGVLKADGFIYMFDKYPADSMLTWGKVGYYRQGFTDLEEVTFNFAQASTGKLFVDISLDGKTVMTPAHYEQGHTNVVQKTIYPPFSGKWFNIGITGQFDISDIQVKGRVKGRR